MEATPEVKKLTDLKIEIIEPESNGYVGDFLPIEKILGKNFIIHKYKIIPSKFPESGNGLALWIQVTYRDELRVITTNSLPLQLTMKQVTEDMLPREANIIRGENKAFKFN